MKSGHFWEESYSNNLVEVFRHKQIYQILGKKEKKFFPIVLVLRHNRLIIYIDNYNGGELIKLVDFVFENTSVSQREIVKSLLAIQTPFPFNIPPLIKYSGIRLPNIFLNLFSLIPCSTIQQINKAQLILEFLYDVIDENEFFNTQIAQDLIKRLQTRFPVNGIFFKAKLAYYFSKKIYEDSEQTLLPINNDLEKEIDFTYKIATDIIKTQLDYDAYLRLSTTWFQGDYHRKLFIEPFFMYTTKYQFKKKVLFLSATPQGSDEKQVSIETGNVRTAFQSTIYRDSYILLAIPGVQFKELGYLIRSHAPHFIHLTGKEKRGAEIDNPILDCHKDLEIQPLVDEGVGYKTQEGKVVIGEEWNNYMKPIKGTLQLVFLNVDFSMKMAESIIQTALFVIAIPQVMPKGFAELFAELFYRALGNGNEIEAAFEDAVTTLKKEQYLQKTPFILPRLFVNKPGGGYDITSFSFEENSFLHGQSIPRDRLVVNYQFGKVSISLQDLNNYQGALLDLFKKELPKYLKNNKERPDQEEIKEAIIPFFYIKSPKESGTLQLRIMFDPDRIGLKDDDKAEAFLSSLKSSDIFNKLVCDRLAKAIKEKFINN